MIKLYYMNLRHKLIAALIVLVASSFAVHAQDASQLEMAKKYAKSIGYTDDEVENMIQSKEKGEQEVPIKEEVEVELLRTVETDGSLTLMRMDTTEFKKYAKLDSIKKADSKRVRIYGHDIFESPFMKFMPTLNVPTPANYKLGPGDEVIIDIWGGTTLKLEEQLSPEGSITIENIGPVYLLGNTVKQAETYLRSYLSTYYSGLKGSRPNTFLRVAVGKIRTINVNVVGDVNKPGTYTMPSLATVTTALYIAGGPTEIGSVRNIGVYRDNKLIKTFDLYDFIIEGDFSSSIRLEDNDLIKVNAYSNLVRLVGKVKRPMIYEMEDGESVSTILDYAQGFSSNANIDRVRVNRQKGVRAESFDVSMEEFTLFELSDGDSLTVYSNIELISNQISITGAVWHQGSYSISDSLSTLEQLIRAAGGLRDEAYTKRGYIQRLSERRDIIAVNFNVENVLNGTEDVLLFPDDSVKIFAYPDLEKKTYVQTYGEVNSPEILVFRQGMTLADVILLSGGFTVGASQVNIDIARRNSNDGEFMSSDTISTVYTFNLLEDPNLGNFELEPYDEIFVRTAPNYKVQQTVMIRGQVHFPGRYVVEKNVVRVSDVVAKSGGFNNDAYIRGATVERLLTDEEYERMTMAVEMAKRQTGADASSVEEVNRDTRYKIGINMEAAMSHKGSYADIILRTGDIINVPMMNNTVKVSGGVLFGNVVSYDPKMNHKDYINMAGGYMKNTLKRDTYVVYMNGTIAKRGTSSFRIEPGCEIVVPMKDMSMKRRITAAEIMGMTTSAATLGTMVVSIMSLLNK